MEVKNKKDFKVEAPYTDEYVDKMKALINKNGSGHNSAYDVEKERSALPQDELVEVFGWTHGVTGLVTMFKWKSGRQDAYIEVDIENPDDLPNLHQLTLQKAS